MAPTEESDPFESTEEHYAEHRPEYGEAAIRYLVDRFDLDDAARVLDLGCGAGQIAVPLAPHVGAVVGVDPNGEMLRHARRRAAAAGVENVEWVVGSDADLWGGDRGDAVDDPEVDIDADLEPLRLVTVGRAFHRMDRERTLDWAYRTVEPGGGVALLGDPEWLVRGTAAWQDEVYAVAERYLDDLPARTGPVEHDDPWDELVAEFGFDVEVAAFEAEREWTVDGVVGYVLSLSYCSPRTFGDDLPAFEADLRTRLTELGGEPFVEDAAVKVIAGRK